MSESTNQSGAVPGAVFDTWYTDNVVCPWCGHEHEDGTEFFDGLRDTALVERTRDLETYERAVRQAHNGYCPSARASMPGLKEPATPANAIAELLEEQATLVRMERDEEIARLQEQVAALAVETVDAVAALARRAEAAEREREDFGGFLAYYFAKRFPTSEAAEDWRAMTDAERAPFLELSADLAAALAALSPAPTGDGPGHGAEPTREEEPAMDGYFREGREANEPPPVRGPGFGYGHSVPAGMVQAPARCRRCKMVTVSPTTGLLGERCHCGGIMDHEPEVANG